ncbi:MAG: hypothetical protein K9L98_02530 [Candidatus Pacebacteria bacterium]|nr:hypothetical protein [Candidatus Paceibacterota bacterium]MCF7862862.1 hypothetical protein [Candidatus Paceibacterota bacterium]
MKDKILLNDSLLNFTENDLPCLVTYSEKTGGSHFSIAMVAELFVSGSKILFLTAYPMAKENFLEQVGENNTKITFVTSIEELNKAKDFQVIILESGNEGLFLEVVKILPDLYDRVVLIKNMEIFSEKVFNICLELEKVILSGDIDACVDKERISKKYYKTMVAFSKPKISLPLEVPVLEKYNGYLLGQNKSGIVKILKDKVNKI